MGTVTSVPIIGTPFAYSSEAGQLWLSRIIDAISKGTQSNSARKVRKVPLILGIAGAAVMAVGIALAADPCDGHAPCFRTGGAVDARVGGAVAVTGFYFAFRR